MGEIVSESLSDFKSVHPGDIIGIRSHLQRSRHFGVLNSNVVVPFQFGQQPVRTMPSSVWTFPCNGVGVAVLMLLV